MQGLTESKVSQRVQHYEQRQGLREGRVSQKATPHRSPGLTEGKASRKPGSHGRPSLTEARVSQKARPHRSQGLAEGQDLTEGLTERQGFTEDRVSPIKQRQGLTEGRSLVWLQACVSHMTQCRVSHNRQGNKGFRT